MLTHKITLAYDIYIPTRGLKPTLRLLITGESNGTAHIAETHARATIINDTLGEIAQLKTTLLDAHAKLESLEQRLQAES